MLVRRLLLPLLLVPLGACAADGEPSAGTGSESHTMSDGTVMAGPRHVHDDDHAHPGESQGDVATGPSEAARMVCAGDVVDDVTRIMGLDRPVEPASSWSRPHFTCTFALPAGPLVLSVHDAPDDVSGEAYFRTLRGSRTDAAEIKGVYSLGLPAYETSEGTVAFVKDGRTLEVDATGLRGTLGSEQDMSRSEIAYAVATSVLACWTQHG